MKKKDEIISAIAVIIFGIAFYACSNMIQPTTSDVLGSRFFPRVAAVVLILLGAIQAAMAMKKGDVVKKAADVDTSDEGTVEAGFNLPLVLTIVALFSYYVLIRIIGFTITSIIYLLFMSWVLMSDKEKKDKKLVAIVLIVSIAFPIFLNTVFYQFFHIALPAGSLFA